MSTSVLPRLRRLRQHPKLRQLVCETRLSVEDLIYPIFVVAGDNTQQPIDAMPGQYQWSVDRLPELLEQIVNAQIPAVLLFGVPAEKDAEGSHSWNDDGIVQHACRLIRERAPELLCIADVCFCEYTDHGHCGVVTENSRGQKDVDNDATCERLGRQAVSLVRAGADMVAPSGMMDGMVQSIRDALDQHQMTHIPIMSYAVKYASALYGPFREAAQGAPQFGDRRTYQMNPANARVAKREAAQDVQEGADILMVKPAGYYLDVVCRVKQEWPQIPLAAYQVSGEYTMIQTAAQQNRIDGGSMMLESLTAIKRAGADMIITYFALQAAEALLGR